MQDQRDTLLNEKQTGREAASAAKAAVCKECARKDTIIATLLKKREGPVTTKDEDIARVVGDHS